MPTALDPVSNACREKWACELMRVLPSKEQWYGIRSFVPILIMGLCGIAMSVGAWYMLSQSENRAAIREFNGRAANQASILENGIDDYWDELYAVQALFRSSNQNVTRGEFESFSRSLISRHSAILNIAWAPRVKRDERAAHEQLGAREGLPDYHIRSLGPKSSLPVSAERDEYFPKFYSTEAMGSPVYGINIDDGADQARTLAHIRDEDALSITAPLRLYTGKGNRLGFWAGLPVYAAGLPHDTVEERRENLRGIVQGVFQIGVMFELDACKDKGTNASLCVFS